MNATPEPEVATAVAERHGLDVDGGAEVGGDPFPAAVEDRPVGVPGVEDGQDGAAQLVAGVLGEGGAGLLLDEALERRDEGAEVVGVEVDVGRDTLGVLGGVDRVLERGPVQAEHGRAVHLDEPPVGVPGEPRVAGLPRQALHRGVAQADVEDRLHHPRHGELRTGADRHEQRVLAVPQPAARPLLEPGEVLVDLLEQALGRVAGHGGRPGTRRS